MGKTLLVDSHFSAEPIYRALLSAGHEVHVTGNNPVAYLAKATDGYRAIDYSDVEALQRLVDQERYDFIVPGCTDRSYLSCSLVTKGEIAGVDTPDNTLTLTNKRKFRLIAQDLQLPVPQPLLPQETASFERVIVKPSDSFSGKGITVVPGGDERALDTAIGRALSVSPNHQFLVEEYVTGTQYSHSAFLSGHKVVADFFVREDSTVNPFAVDTSFVVPGIGGTIERQLRDCVERIATHLELKDGLIHTQFIESDGRVWILELTRRCPGDLYSELIRHSVDYDYCSSYAASFLGELILPHPTSSPVRGVMRHTVTVPSPQTFRAIKFKRPIRLDAWHALSVSGDPLQAAPVGRVAILFLGTDSASEFRALYESTLARQLYEVLT